RPHRGARSAHLPLGQGGGRGRQRCAFGSPSPAGWPLAPMLPPAHVPCVLSLAPSALSQAYRFALPTARRLEGATTLPSRIRSGCQRRQQHERPGIEGRFSRQAFRRVRLTGSALPESAKFSLTWVVIRGLHNRDRENPRRSRNAVLEPLTVIMKGAARMKRWSLVFVTLLVLFALDDRAAAQVAGSTTLGVTVEELKAVAIGWSAKRQILGKPVYNDQNARIGKIDDIIVTPDKSISFVIVGAGGFVGVGRHNVAIPVN